MSSINSSIRLPLVVVAGLVLATLGCAKAKVTSVTPVGSGQVAYHRIMVLFPVSDLGDRERTEQRFIDAYDGPGTMFVRSGSVFEASRPYRETEVAAGLEQQQVDAVLLFFGPDDMLLDGRPREPAELASVLGELPLEAAVVSLLTDPSFSANPSTAIPTDGPCRRCAAQPKLQPSAVRANDPWARSAVVLREVGTGRVAWAAIARATDAFWSDPSRYFQSIAKQTVAQLRQDGVLP